MGRTNLKPIETHYKGYRFRSRLEARWAVFFDALGLPWEYEPEGYDLGELGWYLPDFRIERIWIEIKPDYLENYSTGDAIDPELGSAIKKCRMFQSQTFDRVILITGEPGKERVRFWEASRPSGYASVYYSQIRTCRFCGSILLVTEWSLQNHLPEEPIDPDCGYPWGIHLTGGCPTCENRRPPFETFEEPIEAIRKARSARFEHGESG